MHTILRSMILPCLAFALCLPSPAANAQGGVVFIHPSAGPTGNTQFVGISNGKATGLWYNPQSNTSGSFIHDIATGATTPLRFPGAEQTLVGGIAGNYVAGHLYRFMPTGEYHGFVHDGANWTEFDYPVAPGESVNTYPHAVLPDGTVVGSFSASGASSGFVRSPAGAFTPLDYPGAARTGAFGADRSRVVGIYQNDSFISRGFLYDGTTWTPIDYPGATDTTPRAIDGDLIVGDFYEGQFGTGRNRGVLYDIPSRAFTPFDVPGNSFTWISGAEGDTIIGWFDAVGDEGGARAFVATVPEPHVVCLFAAAGIVGLRRRCRSI